MPCIQPAPADTGNLAAVAFVPVTPTVAALLHQLQQEALEASTAPEPGSIVLDPPGRLRLRSVSDATYHSFDSSDSDDYSVGYLMRTYTRDSYTWSGEESRRDEQGRRWSRRIEAITDDFGDLVEVRQ